MNRVIKFRAWDKNKKVFIPTNTWSVCTLDSNPKALAVMIKNWKDYCVGEYMYDYAQEVQQFTGLHDKNGKEIYEGDIVKTDLCHPSWIGTPYQVIFKDGSFQMKAHVFFRTLSFPYHIHGGIEQGIIENEKDYEQHLEVIGNIYENPELLKP